MEQLILGMPPEVVVWLFPFIIIVLIIFNEIRYTQFKHSLDDLNASLKELNETLREQQKFMNSVDKRITKLEVKQENTEVRLSKIEERV